MVLPATAVMLWLLGCSILALLALKWVCKRFSSNVPYIVFCFILIGALLFQQMDQGRIIPASVIIMILIATFALRMIFENKSKKVV